MDAMMDFASSAVLTIGSMTPSAPASRMRAMSRYSREGERTMVGSSAALA